MGRAGLCAADTAGARATLGGWAARCRSGRRARPATLAAPVTASPPTVTRFIGRPTGPLGVASRTSRLIAWSGVATAGRTAARPRATEPAATAAAFIARARFSATTGWTAARPRAAESAAAGSPAALITRAGVRAAA